jgi:hypothetical protein
MTVALVETRFTVNLFCHVFAHVDLRPQIVTRERELAQFLLGTRGLGDDALVPIVCTIVRRLDISPTLLAKLSKNEFIDSFFHSARKTHEEFRALVVLAKFAEVTIFTGILELCDFVVELLRGENQRLANAAAHAALTMCRHQQCTTKFREARIANWLVQRERDTGPFAALIARLRAK